MPSFQVDLPDGARYQLDADDESQLEPAIDQLRAQHQPQPPPDNTVGLAFRPFGIDTGLTMPTGLGRYMAGYGEAFSNLGKGLVQRAVELGSDLAAAEGGATLDESQQAEQQMRADEADRRVRDAPLNATAAGKAGQIAGAASATLPALAIPGAGTVAGASLIGAVLGAAQPTVSNQETVLNTGLGGVLGAGGQYLGNRVAQFASNQISSRAAQLAAQRSQNAVRDQILDQARQVGYVIPPTDVNPSVTSTALESMAGKAATRQAARTTNAAVTNGLVRQDLGIPANTPITRQVLDGVRAQQGQVYNQVGTALGQFPSDGRYLADLQAIRSGTANLPSAYPGIGAQAPKEISDLVASLSVPQHDGASAVELSKFLRNQATQNFKSAFGSGGNPQALALARAQYQAVDALEGLMGRQLQATGQGPLSQSWDVARTTIAKAHQADAALKGGQVSAVKLAAQMNRGKPATGGMGLAANFADQFGDAAKTAQGGVGVSKLGATAAIGGIATGHPWLAAIPVIGAGARRTILSMPGQRALATPSYSPGLLGNAARNTAQTLGRYGGLLAPPAALVESSP